MDHENVKTMNLTTNEKRQCEEISLIQPMKIKYPQDFKSLLGSKIL